MQNDEDLKIVSFNDIAPDFAALLMIAMARDSKLICSYHGLSGDLLIEYGGFHASLDKAAVATVQAFVAQPKFAGIIEKLRSGQSPTMFDLLALI